MRVLIAAMALIASVTSASAITEAEKEEAVKQANQILLDCYRAQLMHAAKSGADLESFIMLTDKLCEEQRDLLVQGMTLLLRERGASDVEIASTIAGLLAKMDAGAREIYRQHRSRVDARKQGKQSD